MSAVRVAAVGDIGDESAIGVTVAGTPVCVARHEGRLYAISDICSHADVPLSEGDVVDGGIECFLHGSLFNLATGKPTGPPANKAVPTYLVTIEGDDVLVDVHTPGAHA